jgi:hypothetical protein
MGLRGPKSANELIAFEQQRHDNIKQFTANPVKPPPHLAPPTRQWWIEVAHLIEPHQLYTLTAAAEAWDRLQQARQMLDKNGTTYKDDKGRIHRRVECTIEKDSRVGFLKCMSSLRLDLPPPSPPKGGVGYPNEYDRSHWK